MRQSASPVPKAPLCKGSCHGAAVTEGLSGVSAPFWDDLCRNPRPFLAPALQTLRSAPLPQVVDGTFSSFVRADAHIGPLLRTTCIAPVGRGDLD